VVKVYTGQNSPFGTSDGRLILQQLKDKKRPVAPPQMPVVTQAVFEECLSAKPANRPKMHQVYTRLEMDLNAQLL